MSIVSCLLVASVFMAAASGAITEKEATVPAFSQGVKLELPYVTSFLYSSGNWGMEFDVPFQDRFLPESPVFNGRIQMALGNVTVSGPFSKLKSPVPQLKESWNPESATDRRLSSSLPSLSSSLKPYSVTYSVSAGSLYLGAAWSELNDSTEEDTTDFPLGARAVALQIGLYPALNGTFRYSSLLTFAGLYLKESKNTSWYSARFFRPADTLNSVLWDTFMGVELGSFSLEASDSVSIGISGFSRGFCFWNDALLKLSYGHISCCAGVFAGRPGSVTGDGGELQEPFRLYGGFSAKLPCAFETQLYGSCVYGIGYQDVFPLELQERTSIMAGVSVDLNSVSIEAEGAVKNLVPAEDYMNSTVSCSVSGSAGNLSVVLSGNSPLIADERELKWSVALSSKASGSRLAGKTEVNFMNLEFQKFSGELSLSWGKVSLKAEMSLSSAGKLTWSCSGTYEM